MLTQFEQAGILARSQFDSGKAVFELNDGDHHDHLICTNCGKVVEFSDPDIEKRQQKVAKDNGFALESHAMVLYGICGSCLKGVDPRVRDPRPDAASLIPRFAPRSSRVGESKAPFLERGFYHQRGAPSDGRPWRPVFWVSAWPGPRLPAFRARVRGWWR